MIMSISLDPILTQREVPVLVISNRSLCSGGRREFVQRIRLLRSPEASAVTAVILREKDLSQQEYRALAQDILEGESETDAPLILHSFVNVALELGCHAIHLPYIPFLGLTDAQREWFTTLGVSCHSVSEALEAQRLGASYVTASHIFPTQCKPGVPARGLDFLAEVTRQVDIPVYALGGIDEKNMAPCMDQGAKGVCVMSRAFL